MFMAQCDKPQICYSSLGAWANWRVLRCYAIEFIFVWSERNTKTPEAFDLTLIFCNLIPAIFSMRSFALILVVLAAAAIALYSLQSPLALISPAWIMSSPSIILLWDTVIYRKAKKNANEESHHKSSQWPHSKKRLSSRNWNIGQLNATILKHS